MDTNYKKRHVPRILTATILILGGIIGSQAFGGVLREASVNQIVRDVQVVNPATGPRKAVLKESIHDDLGVFTGIESRAELLFQDYTLARLGGETFFSFKAGTRDLKLDKGTLLLQVPKGIGGARIQTAAVTAAITGTTIMIEYLPEKLIKVLVLEGSLRLSINHRVGETVLLTAGKMVIMDPRAKRIPNPVDVDLQTVVKTSPLINGSDSKEKSNNAFSPLPSSGLIDKEIAKQNLLIDKHQLVSSNLMIKGGGSNATAVDGSGLESGSQGSAVSQPALNLTRLDIANFDVHGSGNGNQGGKSQGGGFGNGTLSGNGQVSSTNTSVNGTVNNLVNGTVTSLGKSVTTSPLTTIPTIPAVTILAHGLGL